MLPIGGSDPSVVLDSSEHSSVENTSNSTGRIKDGRPAIQGNSKFPAEDSGLDNLVVKLNERAREWKEVTLALKQSK